MSVYYHLKNNISRIKVLMSQQNVEKAVHAFNFSRLKATTVTVSLYLQLKKNAAAQLLTTNDKIISAHF